MRRVLPILALVGACQPRAGEVAKTAVVLPAPVRPAAAPSTAVPPPVSIAPAPPSPPTIAGNALAFVRWRGDTVLRHGDLQSVGISANGRFGASSDDSGIIAAWDLRSGVLLQTIDTGGAVEHVAISSDGQSLASTGSRDGTLDVWDVARGTLTWEAKHGLSDLASELGLRFSPDGTRLVVRAAPSCMVNYSSCIQAAPHRIFDAATGRPIWNEPGKDSWNNGYAVSLDTHVIAGLHSDSKGDSLLVLGPDLDPHKPARTLAIGPPLMHAPSDDTVLALSATGDRAAVLEPARLRVFAIATGSLVTNVPMTGLDASLTIGLLLTSDAHYALVWDRKILIAIDLVAARELWREERGSFRARDPRTLRADSFVVSDGSACIARAFSDGHELWHRDHCRPFDATAAAVLVPRTTTSLTNALDVVDPSTGTSQLHLPPIDGPAGVIDEIAVSSDGLHLATTSNDGSLWLWDTTTTSRQRLPDPPEPFFSTHLRFLDNSHLAVVNQTAPARAPMSPTAGGVFIDRYDTSRNTLESTRELHLPERIDVEALVGDQLIVEEMGEDACPRTRVDLADRRPPQSIPAWKRPLDREIHRGWPACNDQPSFVADARETRLHVWTARGLQTWDVARARVIASRYEPHEGLLRLSPDEQTLLAVRMVGDPDTPWSWRVKSIAILAAKNLRQLRVLENVPPGKLSSFTFSPDSRLVVATTPTSLLAWRVSDGTRVAAVELASKVEQPSAVAFSPDGTTLWLGTTIGNLLELHVSP